MGANLVFVGDDFTGASDSLATYATHGWRTRLLLSPSSATEAEAADLDAVGIPTDLRSLSPDKAAVTIKQLWPVIAGAEPDVLHFKVCSTLDSSAHIGSIGQAADALAARFQPDVVAVIGGQPSLGRYCVFGHLFARGPDGLVHRIDRHPVMRAHPVTPMVESDLRCHLSQQGMPSLTLITIADLGDPIRVDRALRAGPVLFDVMDLADQQRIGEALARVGGKQLLIGASSVAEIVAGRRVCEPVPLSVPAAASHKVLVFAGSRSETTQRQVARATGYRLAALTPAGLQQDRLHEDDLQALRIGTPLLIHLDPTANYGMSADALADACSRFVARVLEDVPVDILGIAGGDTSSRICARLGLASLSFEKRLDAGVPVCIAEQPGGPLHGMRLMLKGGQMGGEGLFTGLLMGAPIEPRQPAAF